MAPQTDGERLARLEAEMQAFDRRLSSIESLLRIGVIGIISLVGMQLAPLIFRGGAAITGGG